MFVRTGVVVLAVAAIADLQRAVGVWNMPVYCRNNKKYRFGCWTF